MSSSSASLDAIHATEIERFARLIVRLRVAKIRYILIPTGLLWALEPSWERLVLLLVGVLLLYGNTVADVRRAATQEVNIGFVADNVRVLAIVHSLMLLLTGGLNSPMIPVLVMLPMAATVLFGKDAALRPFFLQQIALILLLMLAQLSGLATYFSPSWLEPDPHIGRTVFAALALLVMLRLVYKLGTYIRELFDTIALRAVTTQAELLATHQAQAEELTALSGAIAHELKNPLASIKGLSGLLARDLQTGKPAERLHVLREEVDRMQGTLEEFLNYSRPLTPSQAQPTALRPLVDSVVALHEGMARAKGVRLLVTGEGEARIDARKTRQVLINLLQNALEASSGGSVGLEISRIGDQVGVCVLDEGVGLDPDLGDRIFLPGMTTKAAGNGLGLTIARGLARQQGGELSLAARASGGTRACLLLPGVA